MGSDRHPGWFFNVKANPRVRVEKGDEHLPVVARVAEPLEREGLWRRLSERLPALSVYQDKTDRTIPVVVLTAQEG